jgi:NAD(P)-dependent dehydrogenase (short-subunit alcohol dehydrogenase family)
MPSDLSQRHVVITGGTGGLGPAVVRAFVEAGAICHLPAHGPAPAGFAPPAGVRVVPGVDLTGEPAVEAFYAALPPLWASVHLAGGFLARPVAGTGRADLQRQLDLNLVTAFLCCREAVRAMRAAGAGGRIVNVGSRASEVPGGGTVAYTAAKAAVAGLTRALAEEVRKDGILVNAVLPSVIDTPANREAMPRADHAAWPKPEELARAIVWLASPANTLTSGALVPVYGGA